MPKIAVVLSGCGVFDGAEIHESVITLLALDRAGAEIVITAPNIEQAHVINHILGDPIPGEKRNVLVESARIARGNIIDLAKIHAKDIDGIIFTGGFGAAKNLSTYAFDGAAMRINPEVKRITEEMAKLSKPIGTICIAPVVTAKILADINIPVIVTIGNDEKTAKEIQSLGAIHKVCPVDQIVIDEKAKVVSTPAYMLAHSIKEAAAGIEKLVSAIVSLC